MTLKTLLQGCVLWLEFREPNGSTVYDLSNQNNNGTIYGAERTGSAYGKTLSFDGVDDRVDVPPTDSLNILGPVTVEAWIKPLRYGATEVWVVGGRQYVLYQRSDGKVRLSDTWGNLAETDPIDLTSRFNHVVGVFRGTKGDAVTLNVAEIWINGINKAAYTSGTWSPATMDVLALCYWWKEIIYYFKGCVALVRIYNRALTSKEIQTRYQYPKWAPKLVVA